MLNKILAVIAAVVVVTAVFVAFYDFGVSGDFGGGLEGINADYKQWVKIIYTDGTTENIDGPLYFYRGDKKIMEVTHYLEIRLNSGAESMTVFTNGAVRNQVIQEGTVYLDVTHVGSWQTYTVTKGAGWTRIISGVSPVPDWQGIFPPVGNLPEGECTIISHVTTPIEYTFDGETHTKQLGPIEYKVY